MICEEKGLLLYASGASCPALWSGALSTEPGLAAADIIARATEFLGKGRRGFTLHRMDHLDTDIDMRRSGRVFLEVVAGAFQTLGVAEETWHTAYPDLRSLPAPHIATFVVYVDGAPDR